METEIQNKCGSVERTGEKSGCDNSWITAVDFMGQTMDG